MATISKTISVSLNNTVSDYNRNNTQNKTVGDRNYNNPGQIYYFPSGVASTSTSPFSSASISSTSAYMAFPFYQYYRPTVNQVPALNDIGTIVLPIPNDLKDSQQLYWAEDNVGIAEQAIAAYMKKGQQTISLAENAAEQILSSAADSLTNSVKNVLSRIGIGGNIPQGTILQTQGYTANPYLTMLFKSPVFKRFTFQWLFIPQSKDESDKLNYIINKLRYHALPGFYSGEVGSALYTYPDMCKPILFPSGYQFDFKHCIIENVTIDYVPGNTPAFQATSKSPVAIRLGISLIEVELWSKQDLTPPASISYNNGIPNFGSISGYLS